MIHKRTAHKYLTKQKHKTKPNKKKKNKNKNKQKRKATKNQIITNAQKLYFLFLY